MQTVGIFFDIDDVNVAVVQTASVIFEKHISAGGVMQRRIAW